LQLLVDNGLTPEIVDYIGSTPSKSEIENVLKLLGISAVGLMRTGDARFKEAGLSKTDPESTLIEAMVKQPILIERPVVLHKGKAAIGRPPESVLEIL
jgi:arsenate reductase